MTKQNKLLVKQAADTAGSGYLAVPVDLTYGIQSLAIALTRLAPSLPRGDVSELELLDMQNKEKEKGKGKEKEEENDIGVVDGVLMVGKEGEDVREVLEALSAGLPSSRLQAAGVAETLLRSLEGCNNNANDVRLYDIDTEDGRAVRDGKDRRDRGGPSISVNLPPVALYVGLVDVWANTGYPQKAEAILRRFMASYYRLSIDHTNYTYTTTTPSQSQSQNEDPNARNNGPNKGPTEAQRALNLAWNRCITAYGRAGSRTGGSYAARMNRRAQASVYQSSVSSQAPGPRQRRRAGDKVDWTHVHQAGHLQSLANVNMDNVDNVGEELQGALNAQRLYDELLALSHKDSGVGDSTAIYTQPLTLDVRPSSWTLTSVVSIWATAGFPKKAEELLQADAARSASDSDSTTQLPDQLALASLVRGWLRVYRERAVLEISKISEISEISENVHTALTSELSEISIRVSALFEEICNGGGGGNDVLTHELLQLVVGSGLTLKIDAFKAVRTCS